MDHFGDPSMGAAESLTTLHLKFIFKLKGLYLFCLFALTDNISRKRWRSLLQRVKRKQMEPGCATQLQRNSLFGQALSDVCEKNGNPPKPIMVCYQTMQNNFF